MVMLLPKSAIVLVPKTGTTFVRKACESQKIKFRDNGKGGMTTRHDGIRKVQSIELSGRFIFSFGRYPLEWLKSQWCYTNDRGLLPVFEKIRRGEIKHPSGLTKSPYHLQCMVPKWEDYCDRVVGLGWADRPSEGMFSRWGFVENSPGVWNPEPIVADFVGKVSNLTEHLIVALELAGEEFNPDIIRRMKPQKVAGRQDKYADLVWPKKIAQKILDTNQQLIEFLDQIE